MGFEQGLSGLNAAAKNLEIIGNNVSNANTVGFKTASAQFSDVFARSFSDRSSGSIGRGTSLESVQQNFAQGSITPTNNPLDMAINGKGFFKMKTVQGETLYTRNGQFSIDGDGFIQNAAGSRLMGYAYDLTNGQVSGVESPIQFPQQAIAPRVTDQVVMRFNLDSRENPISASVGLDITDLTTFNSTLAATVYDQLGVDHSLAVYFQKVDPTTNVAGGGNNIKFSGDPIKVSYELPEAVDTAVLTIKDKSGMTVRTLPGTTDKGFQGVTWDGKDSSGTAVLDGDYTFSVAATKRTTPVTSLAFKSVPGNDIAFTGQPVALSYELSAVPSSTSIAILDSTGATVRTLPGSNGLGFQSVSWDGKDDMGASLAAGAYTFQVTTTPSSGITATTFDVGAGNMITKGVGATQLTYSLASASDEVSVQIKDSTGTTVRTLLQTARPSGFQSINWDGNDESGVALAPGNYTFAVRATNGTSNISATTFSAVTFENEVPGATQFYRSFVLLDGKPVTPGGGSSTEPLMSNKIIGFSDDGKKPSYPDTLFPIPYTPKFTLDLKNFDPKGDGALFGSQVTLDFDGSTQYGSSFGVNNVKQNGYESAALSSFSVSSEGILKGRYTNGQTQDLAQIALVTFRNPDGLRPVGANNFVKTAATGTEYLARDDETASSSIVAGSLESANLDLTNELVNIITAQRIYQANAQTVKAQDSILQTLVNLR